MGKWGGGKRLGKWINNAEGYEGWEVIESHDRPCPEGIWHRRIYYTHS